MKQDNYFFLTNFLYMRIIIFMTDIKHSFQTGFLHGLNSFFGPPLPCFNAFGCCSMNPFFHPPAAFTPPPIFTPLTIFTPQAFTFGGFNPFGCFTRQNFSFMSPFLNFNNFDTSNFSTNNSGFSHSRSIGDSFTKTTKPSIIMNSDNIDLSEYGYDAEKGERLATYMNNNIAGKWINQCAKYVKNGIQACGLGQYKNGDAHDCIKILSRNNNFKQIDASDIDVKKLPAGCILVYGKGVAGYSQKYGHVEVTLGNGTAASDNITQNPKNNPTAIFIPV